MIMTRPLVLVPFDHGLGSEQGGPRREAFNHEFVREVKASRARRRGGMRGGAAALVLLALAGALLPGCAGTLPSGRRWGADATLTPGWTRVGQAALNAALDPRTLVPAGAAVVLAFGDLDERLTREAADTTPIFGSRKSAQIYSDAMEGALIAEAVGTGLAAPSGSLDNEWWAAKLKGGLGVEGGALGVAAGLAQLLKEGVGRTRPDGSADDSFPSGHATFSAAAAALASSNLAAQRLDPRVQTIVEVANTVAAASVAWARVEAGAHFATDVFAGAALGNFVGIFMHDAFLGLSEKDSTYWRILPVRGGAMLVIGWTF